MRCQNLNWGFLYVTKYNLSGFYLLGGGEGGEGEASPPKVLLKKKLQLFQIKIFFDDDFKESVKVTNVQNAISANPEHYIFKLFRGSMPPDPPRRPKNFFSRRRVAQKFFSGSTSPPNKKS